MVKLTGKGIIPFPVLMMIWSEKMMYRLYSNGNLIILRQHRTEKAAQKSGKIEI